MLSLLKRKSREWRTNRWNIGFVEEGIGAVLSSQKLQVHWMKHNYKDRWFADPFILEYNEEHIIVLVEEYSYQRKIGRLAKLIVDRKTYRCLSMNIILELPSHLSFPFILRKDGCVYILPENSEKNNWLVYQYNVKTDELVLMHSICNLPLTDATIAHINGKDYVISTQIPNQNKNCLQVYSFDKDKMLLGNQVCDIVFDSNIARNAGEVFMHDGILYRPAQDCNEGYGRGIVLQRIDDKWTCENVCAFYPNTQKYNLGLHTFNLHDGLIVIDAKGYRYPCLGRLLNQIAAFKHFY